EAVKVRIGDDMTLVGWAVRQDTVVVQASGLNGKLTVTVGDQEVPVADTFESIDDPDTSLPMTALQLPEGTLDVTGELFPPHMLTNGASPIDPQKMGARVAFWCLVFPRM